MRMNLTVTFMDVTPVNSVRGGGSLCLSLLLSACQPAKHHIMFSF